MQGADGVYTATLSLVSGSNYLTLRDEATGEAVRAQVTFLPHASPKYRISSDDNLWFLRDLSEHSERYPSLFDHPYLRLYQTAHERYGAKVQLNLFYATDPISLSARAQAGSYFYLSMMTDRYREEFSANAHWLQLSFHAHSEYPPSPYKHATGERLRQDCERVHRQIARFAGSQCISDSITLHWGEATPEGIAALRSLGYRSFMGYFLHDSQGKPVVSYGASDRLIDHMAERVFYHAAEEDVLYGRIGLVLNLRTAEENRKLLQQITQHNGMGSFVSLMIHEQYFYKDYKHHLPDFEARVLEPCQMLFELGYTGSFLSDATAEVAYRT
jgi:hypothetical protein